MMMMMMMMTTTTTTMMMMMMMMMCCCQALRCSHCAGPVVCNTKPLTCIKCHKTLRDSASVLNAVQHSQQLWMCAMQQLEQHNVNGGRSYNLHIHDSFVVVVVVVDPAAKQVSKII